VLSTRDAGFALEVRVLGFQFAPSPAPFGPMMNGFIATTDDELPAQWRVAQPVDFERYVAIAVPGGRDNVLDGGVVLSLEALHAKSDREIEFVMPSSPCRIFGGASITQRLAAECWEKVQPQLFLIPRPKERLIVGFYDESCSKALP
jgi:hypothetical protein